MVTNPIPHKQAIKSGLLVNIPLNGNDYEEEYKYIFNIAKINDNDKSLVLLNIMSLHRWEDFS